MTTTYTVSLELTAEQAKWMKLMVKEQCPTAKFSKARAAVAKAAGDGKKPSVNDLPMDKAVYLTEHAEKAKAGTAFADRKKQVYKKLQGKTIEEMMKGKVTYQSKGKECRFGKKDLLMDYSKAKPFIRFGVEDSMGAESGSESGSEEEAADF